MDVDDIEPVIDLTSDREDSAQEEEGVPAPAPAKSKVEKERCPNVQKKDETHVRVKISCSAVVAVGYTERRGCWVGVDTGAKLEKRGNAGGRENARSMYARPRLELGSEPNLDGRDSAVNKNILITMWLF